MPVIDAFARDALQDVTILVAHAQLLRRHAAGDAPDRARCLATLDALDDRLKTLAVRIRDYYDAAR